MPLDIEIDAAGIGPVSSAAARDVNANPNAIDGTGEPALRLAQSGGGNGGGAGSGGAAHGPAAAFSPASVTPEAGPQPAETFILAKPGQAHTTPGRSFSGSAEPGGPDLSEAGEPELISRGWK